MPNYVSTLTGQQITSVMTQIDQGVPEGWAVGEKNGIPVSSSSPYYHNNAKYYADYAQGQAERAEAAVPVGTAGAVFFDRVQTLTEGQKAQARQNIQAGGSNRNLLDNPWFTVNQRAITTLTANGYIADRWMIAPTPTGASVVNNGDGTITINLPSGSAYIDLTQKFEADFKTAMAGKTVTISAVVNGTLKSITSQFGSINAMNLGGMFVYNSSGISNNLLIRLFQGTEAKTFTIGPIKLELGSVSTLANDAPPNYAEELAKCQRRFVRLKSTLATAVPLVGDFAISAGAIDFTIGLPQSLAKFPTITQAGVQAVTVTGTVAPITSISAMDIIANNLRLRAYGTFTQNTYYKLTISQNSYIDISAEP